MFTILDALTELNRATKLLEKQVELRLNTKKEMKDIIREWRERHRFKHFEPVTIDSETRSGEGCFMLSPKLSTSKMKGEKFRRKEN